MKFHAATNLLLAGPAAAVVFNQNQLKPPPLRDDTIRSSAGEVVRGEGVFQQPIDHTDPSLGTFGQRYWWSSEFWAGPGSPIVFTTPGEAAADGYTGYLTNRTIVGAFAQAIGGAAVLVEHRYWGKSTPFTALTTRNLRFLTLANAVADATRFARDVRFPFDPNGTSRAPDAPWVMSGGSYSGALAAWVESVDPGTFWAYHASSAVVEAVGDFWQYFSPVQLGMPKNCSADVTKVIDYVDNILTTGSDEEKRLLKKKFGLEAVEHDDDFASAIQNGPWQWQGHDIGSGYSDFYQWCDFIENAVPKNFPNSTGTPGPEGVGLEKALNGYTIWTKEILIPGYCADSPYWRDKLTLECLDSYNASSPYYTDVTVQNSGGMRQWMWLLCNEPFKFWQNGAPAGTPTIVSRLINNTYWERQCPLYFPPEDGYAHGIARGLSEKDVNAWTGGWTKNTTRVTWVNGEFDPWRDATVSSTSRPGGELLSTAQAPVAVIPGGVHCSDIIMKNAAIDPAGHGKVIREQIDIIKGWVQEFYAGKH